MMGHNQATAAEELSTLLPLQKSGPEAEAKMIPFDHKVTEKGASSLDHPNYPSGWIMKNDDDRPSWLPPEWNFVKKTRQSGGSKGHVDKVIIYSLLSYDFQSQMLDLSSRVSFKVNYSARWLAN